MAVQLSEKILDVELGSNTPILEMKSDVEPSNIGHPRAERSGLKRASLYPESEFAAKFAGATSPLPCGAVETGERNAIDSFGRGHRRSPVSTDVDARRSGDMPLWPGGTAGHPLPKSAVLRPSDFDLPARGRLRLPIAESRFREGRYWVRVSEGYCQRVPALASRRVIAGAGPSRVAASLTWLAAAAHWATISLAAVIS